MTRHNGNGPEKRPVRAVSRSQRPSPLSLRQPAPADWLHDRPAYSGDPFMDWESGPEPPKELRWTFTERRSHSRS